MTWKTTRTLRDEAALLPDGSTTIYGFVEYVGVLPSRTRTRWYFSETVAPPTIVTTDKKGSPSRFDNQPNAAWPTHFSKRLGQLAATREQCSLA